MKILETIKKWFGKKPEPEIKNIETNVSPLPLTKVPLTYCQYCHKHFIVNPPDIFPIEVPLLYKDETITGKGYKCPYCQSNNVIG